MPGKNKKGGSLWEGKKAGGHFATVGELGAETMWIPDNAAVIPHNELCALFKILGLLEMVNGCVVLLL